ncbi:MAG: PAS domain S-box protein [Alphaproteobacteria bacterium]|nr:PAS domain S-box protein [Alphaproteobacteria bacterium]
MSRWFDNSRWLFAAVIVVGVGLIFVGTWVVTAGPADPVAHTAAFLKHLVSPWMLAAYVVAWSLIGFGAWRLRSGPKRAVDLRDLRTVMKRTTLRLVSAWLIAAVSLAAIGFLYISDLENTSREERSSQQESVARLKAQQIDKWLLERTIDVNLLATSLRGLPLGSLPADRDVEQLVQLLFAEVLAGDAERTGVSLIASDGKVLAQAGEDSTPDKETTQAAMAFAANPAERRRGIIDVHLDGTPPRPRMVFLLPITSHPGNGPTTAVLAMTVDPFQGLLPQIATWPTTSRSSEAVVVRREGDDVVFISPPPLLKPVPGPLAFRAPLADNMLPSAKAALEGDGVRSGPDYRGVEVLTASRRVSGVPWIVVAKTDLEEITRPLRRKEFTLIVVIGAAVGLAAITMIVLWRAEYVSLLAVQARHVEEHAAMSRHFGTLIRRARDMVLLSRPDGLIVEANEAAVAAYGYSAGEFRALNVRDLVLPEDLARFDAIWNAPNTPDGLLVEAVNRRKDGTVFPIEVSGNAIEVDGRMYRQIFIRDITKRKALEVEVARLSRVQSALQATTSVLLRAGQETELFQEMCEILVQLGGYRMTFVGMPNSDEGKTVRFVAIAGVENGYLAGAAISWGEGARSVGPTGTALRTGEMQVNQNFITNPAVAPWRDEALKRGYHASICLPLKIDGKVFACLGLYAEQPEAFDEEEVRLLLALTEDIAYAVSRLPRS